MKGLVLPILCLMLTQIQADSDIDTGNREKKLLPIFQVVKFPNDPCTISGGSKNGTCYTTEECSSKGGVNAGSCASGFGTCCTFTMNCGGTSAENCTYFDSATTVVSGACKANICKVNTNICQIRLDFSTFIISGPSTSSVSVGLMTAGNFNPGGKEVTDGTQCLTDTFTITNQVTVPMICGINTGYHVYFDASDACNSLDFQFGNVAQGLSTVATRSWSIKINQYSCDYENLAPSGCTQWHFASDATNYVYTFNYQTGADVGKHLAHQRQVICVRRETGNCKICWSADAATDIGVSGDTNIAKGVVLGTKCCNYGADGLKIATTKGGYDCVIIPGAMNAASALKPPKICGSMMGLITATGTISVTVCSKSYPFRIEFHSDGYEYSAAANDEGTGNNPGFKLRYFQTTC